MAAERRTSGASCPAHHNFPCLTSLSSLPARHKPVVSSFPSPTPSKLPRTIAFPSKNRPSSICFIPNAILGVQNAICFIPNAILGVQNAICFIPNAILDVQNAICFIPNAILDVQNAICFIPKSAKATRMGFRGFSPRKLLNLHEYKNFVKYFPFQTTFSQSCVYCFMTRRFRVCGAKGRGCGLYITCIKYRTRLSIHHQQFAELLRFLSTTSGLGGTNYKNLVSGAAIRSYLNIRKHEKRSLVTAHQHL